MIAANVLAAQRQATDGCRRLYPPGKMARMQRVVNGSQYRPLGHGFQHNVFQEVDGAHVVKVTRSIDEELAAFRTSSTPFAEAEMKKIEASIGKISAQAIASYVPVKERSGKSVWAFDLVTGVTFPSADKVIESPIAVVQDHFRGLNLKSVVESASAGETRSLLDKYLGSLYNLSRYGIFNRDWSNFEDAIIPRSQPNAPLIVFLDPFFSLTTRADVDNLASEFEAFLSVTFTRIGREGVSYLPIFKEVVRDFMGRFDFFRNFGADIDKAQRVPDIL